MESLSTQCSLDDNTYMMWTDVDNVSKTMLPCANLSSDSRKDFWSNNVKQLFMLYFRHKIYQLNQSK